MTNSQPEGERIANHRQMKEPIKPKSALFDKELDSGPDIFINTSVLAVLKQSCQKTNEVEGFLGGQLVFSRFRPVLVIETLYFYPLTSSQHQLDSEYMDTAQEFFYENLPDTKLLGWFSVRSHQNLQLSTRDLLLTQMFFGDHWQVALLVDQQTGDCTFYSWQNGVFRASRRVRTVEVYGTDDEKHKDKQIVTAEEAKPSKERAKRNKSRISQIRNVLVVILFLLLAGAVASHFMLEPASDSTGTRGEINPSASIGEMRSQLLAETSVTEKGSEPLQAEIPVQSIVSESSPKDDEHQGTAVAVITSVEAEPSLSIIEYRVTAGDTLWEISERFLGEASRYREILELNPHVSNPNHLLEGITLRIPVSSDSP